MILYPAIDLKGGRCVRLMKGDMDQATVYPLSPAEQAQRFAADGFPWLHVVDLDGAVEGRAVNAEAVQAILNVATVPVQLGGGVRTLKQVEDWLRAGVSRVILGTAAVADPAMVAQAADMFPGQIAVGLDLRGGLVATRGWVETSALAGVDVARRMEDFGVAALIVTDIARDGALSGVNVEAVGEVADAVATPVIASGGVASVDDITALQARPGMRIQGAILGRALYVGAVKPAEALAAAGHAALPAC